MGAAVPKAATVGRLWDNAGCQAGGRGLGRSEPEPGPALARGTVRTGQECRSQGIWRAGELAGARRPQRWTSGVPGSQGSRGGGVEGTREAHGNSYLQKDVLCPSLIVAFHFQAVSE